jgi:hypothetical protein
MRIQEERLQLPACRTQRAQGIRVILVLEGQLGQAWQAGGN